MKTPKYHTLEEALQKLMRFCTYRERCHKEVKQKLYQLQILPEYQDEIIVKLISEDFLNDERFAKTFAYDKFNLQKWGRYRIRKEHESQQISGYLIDKALLQIDEEEYLQTFKNQLEKTLQSISETHPLKKKRKIVDYLLRKGFESPMVYDAVNNIDFK